MTGYERSSVRPSSTLHKNRALSDVSAEDLFWEDLIRSYTKNQDQTLRRRGPVRISCNTVPVRVLKDRNLW